MSIYVAVHIIIPMWPIFDFGVTHNTNADVARHKSKQEVDTDVHVSVDGWILLLMSLY